MTESISPLRTGIPLLCPACKASELDNDAGSLYCSSCTWSRTFDGSVIELTASLTSGESRQTEIYNEIQKGHDQTSDPFRSFVSPEGYQITRMLNKLPLTTGDRFLEIGGAAGPLVDSISTNTGAVGMAIDISPASVSAQLRRRGNRQGYDAVVASATDLPFPDNTFDAVIAFDLMEHIETPKQLLSEIYRVLKPGGRLLMRGQVMDFGGTADWLKYHFMRKKWIAKCHEVGHYYENFRTKRQWKQMASELGFKTIISQGYDIFWDNIIEYTILPMFAPKTSDVSRCIDHDSEDGISLAVPQSRKHKFARFANRLLYWFLLPERLLGRLGFGASLWLSLEKK